MSPAERPAGTSQSVPGPTERSSGVPQVEVSEIAPQVSWTRMYGPASVVLVVELGVEQENIPASLLVTGAPPPIDTSAKGMGQPGCSQPEGQS